MSTRDRIRGATVTSDAGLLLPRELDEHLGLGALIERHLTDPRSGRNRQFALSDLFRQSIYSRLAGYEDTNDAERLAALALLLGPRPSHPCYPQHACTPASWVDVPGRQDPGECGVVSLVCYPGGPLMDAQALLLLIRQKLQDGRLPRKSITSARSYPSDGESCHACDTPIAKDQSVKEVTLASGRGVRGAISFHVVCFQLWDVERRTPQAPTA